MKALDLHSLPTSSLTDLPWGKTGRVQVGLEAAVVVVVVVAGAAEVVADPRMTPVAARDMEQSWEHATQLESVKPARKW